METELRSRKDYGSCIDGGQLGRTKAIITWIDNGTPCGMIVLIDGIET